MKKLAQSVGGWGYCCIFGRMAFWSKLMAFEASIARCSFGFGAMHCFDGWRSVGIEQQSLVDVVQGIWCDGSSHLVARQWREYTHS